MRQARALMLAALAALTASACADSMTDEMRGELGAARAENDRHHAGAAAAASMGDMMTELARHEQAMDDIMGGMGDTLGRMMSMSRCAGSGMEQMMGTMGDLHTEMARHRSELEAAPGLGAAQAECERHFAALADMLDMMDDGLAGMRMRCGM